MKSLGLLSFVSIVILTSLAGCSSSADSGASGAAVQSFSDARLDGVEEKCFADLKPGLTCDLSFTTCVIPLLQEDLGAKLVCRARR